MTRLNTARLRWAARHGLLSTSCVVVQPLWAMYHGRGADLVAAIDQLGDDVLWLESGPMFGDAEVFGEAGPN